VLINLINNAVKFGDRLPIEIFYESTDEALVFRVKDHGMGIGKSDLKRIFNEFEQASSGKEKHGLGLGLYITREIVRAHGGKIRVSSKLGKGSEFEITIPRTDYTDSLGEAARKPKELVLETPSA
jgi:signal transduction histidine kinase